MSLLPGGKATGFCNKTPGVTLSQPSITETSVRAVSTQKNRRLIVLGSWFCRFHPWVAGPVVSGLVVSVCEAKSHS